jgi:hypothetical protein
MTHKVIGQIDADQQRQKIVYKYLFSFTDLGIGADASISTLIDLGYLEIDRQGKKLPNESLIARQWNVDGLPGIDRVYVRRVLRRIYEETLYDKSKESWPGLSMAKLTIILSSLERYWQNPPENKHKVIPPKVTHLVKIEAIRMFSELSLGERKILNLATPSGEGLIVNLYTDVLNPSYKFGYEELTDIYQQYLTGKTISKYRNYATENIGNNNVTITDIINSHICDLTGVELSRVNEEPQKGLRERILREINRLEFQSGVEQLRSISHLYDDDRQKKALSKKMFIQHLTKCILENGKITDELPISIKFFTLEKVRPLPLFIYHKQNNPKGLINAALLSNKEIEITGLERQYTYKLGIHLSVRDVRSKEVLVEFNEHVIGIGSPMSHAVAAIDRVLMWDIPCLKDYFPVSGQQFSNDELIGGNQNSSIWSHCVVQLYKKKDVERAIREKLKIEEVTENSTSYYGEYCGFDVLETFIKSALYARLRAIKFVLQKNNISSDEYINQLCCRVNEYDSLSLAKNQLKYYPFSLSIMEATINAKIFSSRANGILKEKYRKKDECQDFHDLKTREENGEVKFEPWSLVAYNSHLAILEALLVEGRTVAAKKYLDILGNHTESLSDLMLAQYYVCFSQYHFLSDLENNNDHPDRLTAISAVKECLSKAEYFLNSRLQKCKVLGELSRSNIHPFFKIYSQIAIARARLHLYFPVYMMSATDNSWDRAKAPLVEAEKARIYSARDGNASLYFSQSCFEIWAYLILAFTWDFEKYPKEAEEGGFSKESCIDWSIRLLRHAIICYEESGLKCYADIKRNAGFSVDFTSLCGDEVFIEKIPFIREKTENDQEIEAQEINLKVLPLNLDIFKTREANSKASDPPRPIFFGTDSSSIMFAYGMIDLCKTPDQPEDSTTLFENIFCAIRKFIIAWSISRDGAYLKQTLNGCHITGIFDSLPDGYKEDDFDLLKKIDEEHDRYVRGFYPHRISKTAIFSKLFIGVCLLIINCKKEESKLSGFKTDLKWDEIRKLICEDGLHEKKIPEEVEHTKQVRFNGHLAEHITRISEYFENFEDWTLTPQCKSLNSIQVRDKVLKDIFTLIKGGNARP